MPRKPAHGFALLEVLLASMVIAMGIVAVVGLHLQGVQISAQTQMHYRATLHAQSVAAVLQSQTSPDPSLITYWRNRIAQDLVQGQLDINSGAPNTITNVRISWQSNGKTQEVQSYVLP